MVMDKKIDYLLENFLMEYDKELALYKKNYKDVEKALKDKNALFNVNNGLFNGSYTLILGSTNSTPNYYNYLIQRALKDFKGCIFHKENHDNNHGLYFYFYHQENKELYSVKNIFCKLDAILQFMEDETFNIPVDDQITKEVYIQKQSEYLNIKLFDHLTQSLNYKVVCFNCVHNIKNKLNFIKNLEAKKIEN